MNLVIKDKKLEDFLPIIECIQHNYDCWISYSINNKIFNMLIMKITLSPQKDGTCTVYIESGLTITPVIKGTLILETEVDIDSHYGKFPINLKVYTCNDNFNLNHYRYRCRDCVYLEEKDNRWYCSEYGKFCSSVDICDSV